MRRSVTHFLFFSLLIILFGCSPSPSGDASKSAPDFTLRDMQGAEHRLSDYRGKIVFLNFWATWCPPCREEMPSMERLNEVLSGKDFVMLAVNVDDDRKTLDSFLQQHPHSFAVLHDGDASVQKLYQVFKFPETLIISRDGEILERVVGARDWSSTPALKYFSDLIKK